EVGESVGIDGDGNVLLTGYILENVDFGGGPLVGVTANYDVFLAKFNSSGTHQWSKRYSAPFADHGNSVVADGNGNVILTGDFYRSEDFGGGIMNSPGGTDGFLVKLGP